MPKRKKKTKQSGKAIRTGSLKGFILFTLSITALLFYTNHPTHKTTQEQITQQLNEKLEALQKKASQAELFFSGNINKSSLQASSATGISQYSSKLEIPVMQKKREEIKLIRTGYTLSYNPYYKTPNWVAWELTRKEVEGREKRRDRFVPDPDLPEPKVLHSDYTRSGYDRGHMAPAADMKWSKQAMQESFYMSNICPQNQKLNRNDWGDLEDICRKWAQKYGTIHIACGPIYDQKSPKRIGAHKVAVPDRFYKVILIYNRKNPIAMGFLFDNKSYHQTLSKYMVPVDSIEKITAMDFFSKLPDNIENQIEAQIPSMPSY